MKRRHEEWRHGDCKGTVSNCMRCIGRGWTLLVEECNGDVGLENLSQVSFLDNILVHAYIYIIADLFLCRIIFLLSLGSLFDTDHFVLSGKRIINKARKV